MTGAGRRDTIFALSSGAPPAAIGIVRISGPMAGDALGRLAGALPAARHATVRTLRSGSGEPLDRALVLWFPGPATATGEDLAELHLHGGRATVARMLAELAGHDGLRLAEPGEFTRQALENGRIDLAEAEGLADLLAAETERQRRHAMRAAEGGLSRIVEGWRGQLLTLAARIEARIEFGEDELDVGDDPTLGRDIAAMRADIDEVLARSPAERLRDGVRIVVAGPVNSGKSSLINHLAGRNAAIATPVAGTTRDLIEVPVILDGEACILIDSAGLRDTDDVVEREGIARAGEAIASADLILWLGRATDRPRDDAFVVASRCDVVPPPADGRYEVAISLTTGTGLQLLRHNMLSRVRALLPDPERPSFLLRQREALASVSSALAAASGPLDDVIRGELVRQAMSDLDRVIGRTGIEDMLDTLFGRFCIGK